ncbi:hypothetical protein CWC46_14335 [Prodigiosinella confusarubida]|uniref:Uncharacterized protein n=1 Tax=Serratia sp. (strain ATCC 39006) TaxID=104623 RepID=V3UZ19_SERS3|nr:MULTISPECIES: hypothetical protein [Enterobacterales]AUG99729.1 hypothetical protein CWC46_07775 [Serratia sp. ATCC 39006]AUH00882.1 hypothetical protein CWC46_14335 [Serratia sp. ATCC 39006]AUH04048.1 hypothetical protein Ser39006_007780 [Serratia sp. ATCC 39006]AUH05204.1 hypothetical protein Ser39006_014340 [Serratia sp. ATCC 39006]
MAEEQEQLPATGYAVVRCRDQVVVAKFMDFPDCDRALMYRSGDMVSFMPLQHDEIVGTPSLFMQMLEKAGYRITSTSGNIPS